MDFTTLDRLRIYLGEADRIQDMPAYIRIVELARNNQMAGATVFKGMLGYGAHSLIHTAKILRMSEDLPVVVELIDTEDKIEAFLAVLDVLVFQGLVVRETISACLVTKVRRS